jgi:quinolinate synthase
MNRISDIQEKIVRLKSDTDTCIIAHSYMNREIIEIADYTGDSYKISVDATESSAENIIVCGVRFMAETAKILSPKKRVFLPNPLAGCPMAEQFTADDILALKRAEPDRAIVAYVNTTAELKKHCDVCVTSSSAVKIVSEMQAEKILFIPDCNLGDYVRRNVDKDIKTIDGGCPVHSAVTADDVAAARLRYPDALLAVHPECAPDVLAAADFVGSTSAIMDYARKSDAGEFIIGTEMSIREHLQYEISDKKFYVLSGKICCPDMRMTTLNDVLDTLTAIASGNDCESREIIMGDDDIAQSRMCIDEMLRLGGEI